MIKEIVRRPRALKVSTIQNSRLPRRQKRKTLVAWAECLPKSPDLFVCQCRPGPFGQTVEFFLSPSSCTSCYGNQVDACDQGFVSTMLRLKFRSDGYPLCVWGLCSSSEDAKARLGWLVVVHDVPGPLAVFRERDQTFVFLRDSTGAIISTSRGIYHLRCPYISFSSGSRSAESFEQLTLVQKLVHARSPVTNLAGHSAIVKKKQEEINMNKYCHGRTALFSSRRCRTCIGPATQIKTLFISVVKKKPERARVCDLKGARNEQAT